MVKKVKTAAKNTKKSKKVKIALIGLDTSHAIAFPEIIQERGAKTPLEVISCLRFETPFQGKEGLDKRQAILKGMGIKVTENFDEAIEGADALMLEVNDPAYHVEYFSRCAKLGLPIFLDKPFADTYVNALKIDEIARENKVKYFTSSTVRFVPSFRAAGENPERPKSAIALGPMGKAPAGSSIVWYGCHTFEILREAMGPGAVAVTTINNLDSVVCNVEYADGRHAVVDLSRAGGRFAMMLHYAKVDKFLESESAYPYGVTEFEKFFTGGPAPVSIEESLDIIAMLDAAERSSVSGRTEVVYKR